MTPKLGVRETGSSSTLYAIASRAWVKRHCGTSARMIEKTYAKILAEKRRDSIERGAPTFAESHVQ